MGVCSQSFSHPSVLPLLSQRSKSFPVTCRQGTGMRQSIPVGRKNLASTIHMGFSHSPSQRSFIPFYCTWKRWSSYGFLMEQERKNDSFKHFISDEPQPESVSLKKWVMVRGGLLRPEWKKRLMMAISIHNVMLSVLLWWKCILMENKVLYDYL